MKSVICTLVTAILFINHYSVVGFDVLDKKCCCIKKGGPSVQRLDDGNFGFACSLVYMEHKKCLVFIDKTKSCVIEYNIETGKMKETHITETDSHLTSIIPVKNKEKCYVLADGTSLYALCSKCGMDKGYNMKRLGSVLNNNCTMKGAQATCKHNLMTVTSNQNHTKGAIMSVEIGMTLKVEKKCDKMTSGFAWNKGGSCFYAVHDDKIIEYKYNKNTDSFDPGQGKCVFNMANYKHLISGKPRAIRLDSDGHLWIGTCGCGGSALVICYDLKTNAIIKKIALPSSCITSIAWGGKGYEMLFVATTNKEAKDPRDFPHGSGIFAISETGECGFPANKVAVPKERLPCAC